MQLLSQAHHIKACLSYKSLLIPKLKYRLCKLSLPLLVIGSLLFLSHPVYAQSNSNNSLEMDLVAQLDEGLLPDPKHIDANSKPEHDFEEKEQPREQSSNNILINNDSSARATNGSLIGDNTKAINTASTRQGVLAGGGVTSPAGLIKWLLSTIFILGIIFVLAYILKKSRLVQRTTGSSMTLIGQMAVDSKERLIQIKVGERYLLLGVTPQNVNLVADLSSDFIKEPKGITSNSNLDNENNSYRSYQSSDHGGAKEVFLRKKPRLNCQDQLEREQAIRAQKDRSFTPDHLSGSNFNSSIRPSSKDSIDNSDITNVSETSSLEAYWDDPVFSKLLDGADDEQYRPNNGRYTKEQLENLGYWFESELDYHEGHNFDINNQQRHNHNNGLMPDPDLVDDNYDDFDDRDIDALYKEHLMASRARRRLVRRNPINHDYYSMPNDDVLKERALRAKMNLANSRKFEQKLGSDDDFGTIFNHAYDKAQEKLNIDPIVPQNSLDNTDLEHDSLVEEVSVADIDRHQELSSGVQNAPSVIEEQNKGFDDSNKVPLDNTDEVEVDVLLAIDEAVENSKPINNQSSIETTKDLNQVVMINDGHNLPDDVGEQVHNNHSHNNRSKYNKSSKRKGRSSKSRNFGL